MAGAHALSRYTWLVDTLRRCGRLTRAEIDRRWADRDSGNGSPMSRRTFYNYRRDIQDLFGISIECDPSTNEYYIANDDRGDGNSRDTVTDWLLDSAAMSGLLADARSISDRIFVEHVPSARHNLAPIIDAVKHNHAIRFTYAPFSRTVPTRGVVVEPYLLKLFRQRWYVAGRAVADDRIKTYALDRISDVEVTDREFQPDPDFDPAAYFAHSFGIIVDSSRPRRVTLRTSAREAKYLRALPLHESQEEMMHEEYSVFHYHLQLTYDFIQELMSLGPAVKVEAPDDLRALLTERLRATLALYE